MKIKNRTIKICGAVIGLLFCIKTPVYAFDIETLDESSDFQEISAMEEQFIKCGIDFCQEGTVLSNDAVAYEKAVKVYVDTNIFQQEQLTAENVEAILESAIYLWEVPVELPAGGYVICTVSRKPPIDEESQREFLISGTYTQEELNESLEEVGEWVLPTYGYDETGREYIGHLEKAAGESYNANDSDMMYLLGGTPNMRLPFGLWKKGDSYQIVTMNTAGSMAQTDDARSSEPIEEYEVYDFEQVRSVIAQLPPESGEGYGGGGLTVGNSGDIWVSATLGGGAVLIVVLVIAAVLARRRKG